LWLKNSKEAGYGILTINEICGCFDGLVQACWDTSLDILKTAIHEQIEKGYEIGPQHEGAGEVCKTNLLNLQSLTGLRFAVLAQKL